MKKITDIINERVFRGTINQNNNFDAKKFYDTICSMVIYHMLSALRSHRFPFTITNSSIGDDFKCFNFNEEKACFEDRDNGMKESSPEDPQEIVNFIETYLPFFKDDKIKLWLSLAKNDETIYNDIINSCEKCGKYKEDNSLANRTVILYDMNYDTLCKIINSLIKTYGSEK